MCHHHHGVFPVGQSIYCSVLSRRFHPVPPPPTRAICTICAVRSNDVLFFVFISYSRRDPSTLICISTHERSCLVRDLCDSAFTLAFAAHQRLPSILLPRLAELQSCPHLLHFIQPLLRLCSCYSSPTCDDLFLYQYLCVFGGSAQFDAAAHPTKYL